MSTKVSVVFILLTLGIMICQTVSSEATPPSTVEVDIPEYTVEKRDGWDYVEVSGGDTLLVEGKPMVPYYPISIEYPKGYRVQNVIMTERSGLETETGLNISVVMRSPQSSPVGESSSTNSGGWYPEADYEWRTWMKSDCSSDLIISIYIFYYNANTTEVKFYRHYKFDIIYIFSTVSIIDLSTDKETYDPGEEVAVDVLLENSGAPKDIVTSGLIKQYGSDGIVDGLPLRTLHNVVGETSVSMAWNSQGFPTGDYIVEVTLNDTSGNWLDRRNQGFRVGRALINVTSFSAEPQHFKISDEIRMTLEIVNAGSMNLSGTCIFKVQEAHSLVEEFNQSFFAFSPGKHLTFTSMWNTSSAKKGAIYDIFGYVRYEGQTTPPMTAVVSTNYFPTANFTYTPVKIFLGQNVTFNASNSSDPDGTITSYHWQFGDGAEASGITIAHAYYEIGYYQVMLTVADNEGAQQSFSTITSVAELPPPEAPGPIPLWAIAMAIAIIAISAIGISAFYIRRRRSSVS